MEPVQDNNDNQADPVAKFRAFWLACPKEIRMAGIGLMLTPFLLLFEEGWRHSLGFVAFIVVFCVVLIGAGWVSIKVGKVAGEKIGTNIGAYIVVGIVLAGLYFFLKAWGK